MSPAVGMVVLLLCAAFFALHHSNAAFSSDEVWTIKAANLDYSSEITAFKADVHPPLYFLLMHWWLRVLGTSERAVRSFSGLFYLFSIVALYAVSRQLYAAKTALLCATIYMCSPLAILSAQFARMYALLSLLSILSTWLYLQFMRPSSPRLSFALYVFVNILGTFTHLAFFFLLFAQVLFLFAYFRQSAKRFAFALILSATPYVLLWTPILLKQIGNSAANLAWIKKPNLSMALDLLLLYGGALWLLVPVFLYLWWRSGFRSNYQFVNLRLRSLPLWLLIITLSVPLLISFVRPIFNSRLAIVALPLFALTVGGLIGARSNYLLISALVLLTTAFLVVVHPSSTPCDNRELALYLSRAANDGDAVIFTSLTRLPIDYYLERMPKRPKLFETSFPAEIDRHPGYEGALDDPSRLPAFEREAAQLVTQILGMSSPGSDARIFFLHGAHNEVDSVLEKRLTESFQSRIDQGIRCADSSPYLKRVSVYNVR